MMRQPQDGDRLICSLCSLAVEVSVEDPDSSVSELFGHLWVKHGLTSAAANQAAQESRLVDRRGKNLDA